MISPRRALIILNPSAGKKDANRRLTDIVTGLFSHGYLPTVVTTTKAIGGDELVRLYGQNADLILCIGGDGTLHQVIDGVIDRCPNVPIGFIGAGTTNDFAKSVGIPTDIDGALKNILCGEAKPVDIGVFGHERFTYVASCGAFTGASYSTPRSLKNSIGYPAYILEGICSLPDIHPIPLKIRTKNAVYEGDFIFAAVCNTASLGGILKLNPGKVCISDGALECLLIRMPKTVQELAEILVSLRTMEYNTPLMHFFRTSHIVFHTPERLDWSLDGEHAVSHGRAEIRVLPRAVRLILPRKKRAVARKASAVARKRVSVKKKG